MTDFEVKEKVEVKEKTTKPWSIILYNDDVNTFEHVILSLIEICDHSLEQAEQCALLVHHKGKCEVKRGEIFDLIPKHEALLERKLSTKIE